MLSGASALIYKIYRKRLPDKLVIEAKQASHTQNAKAKFLNIKAENIILKSYKKKQCT